MSDLIEELGYLSGGSRFRRIYEKLQIGGDKVYKEAGLHFKSSWFPVYYALAGSDRPQTVMEITDQIAFTHITVKNIVRELEQEELIRIAPNPNDKRSKLISLSDKGHELLLQLKPLWHAFSEALRRVMTSGHPDIINILRRIDYALKVKSLNERVSEPVDEAVAILDYQPTLKKHFFELAGHWLSGYLKGQLEAEDEHSLHHPDQAYILSGGFVLFAKYHQHIVGCVALKRLDENRFELAKLFVEPRYRHIGIASQLIHRCISRCRENEAHELWLQTTLSMPEGIKLYKKLGFKDRKPPATMAVLKRTEKIMCMELDKIYAANDT